MKYVLTGLLIGALLGCSSAVDGLWIEKNEQALLKFYNGRVVNNSLQATAFRDTLGFRMTNDSITWTGLNPELNHGRTENSFLYRLNGDSLKIWYSANEPITYFRTSSKSFGEYFLTKGDLDLTLPAATNVRPAMINGRTLDIRVGFSNKKPRVFVEDEETALPDLDKAIKKFSGTDSLGQELMCRIFMDEQAPCEITFWLFDHLRANGIRNICFVANTDLYNPLTSDFWGLRFLLPPTRINIVEVEDERQ